MTTGSVPNPATNSAVLRLAGAALVVAALGYVLIEAAVATAWVDPPYSYAENLVPSLGSTACGPYSGQIVCSPLHGLMNVMLVVHGVLVGGAGMLLSRYLSGRPRRAVAVSAVLYAAGIAMVSVFHHYEGMPVSVRVLNIVGAFVAIFAGGTIAILTGFRGHTLRLPRWVGGVGVALGAFAIVAGVGFFALSLGGLGVRERVSIYPLLGWQLLVGLVLVWAWRRPGDPRGVPLMVIICAWAVPVLVAVQFAWLATVPVALVLFGVLVDRRLVLLRWPAVALVVVYAIPYVIWKTRADPAPSLSRDINPLLAVLVCVAAFVVVVTFYVNRRRLSGTFTDRSS